MIGQSGDWVFGEEAVTIDRSSTTAKRIRRTVMETPKGDLERKEDRHQFARRMRLHMAFLCDMARHSL